MINVAVIGVGNMGKNHARNYFEIEDSNLVAVCDTNEESGSLLANKLNCKYYKDAEIMFKKEKIDAVSIAVPTSLHKKIALMAIENGKHVLLEKPISDNEKDAEEIIEKAKQKSIKLLIGHIERFNPAVIKIKEIIDSSKLGVINTISAKRVGLFPSQIKDSNVVIDVAIHDVEIINFLLGDYPTEVYANLGKALGSTREDYADILLKYKKSSGVIQCNWITPIKIRQVTVTGTKGYAELNYMTQELVVYENNYEKEFDNFGEFIIRFGDPNKVEIDIKKGEPLRLEILHFLECIKKDIQPNVSGKDALDALKIALKILKRQ